jgi:transcription elongation factor Elf1
MLLQPKLHVDIQWMHKISLSLLLFRKVKTDVYVCRCPVCGDSKNDKTKCRFYFYVKKGILKVSCKNCGYPSPNSSFYFFMKDQFSEYFDEYKKDTLFDGFTSYRSGKQESDIPSLGSKPSFNSEPNKPSMTHISDFKKKVIPILNLSENHTAYQYLVGRKFQSSEMSRLYYTDDFKSISKIINEESSENLLENDPRIIIPFINENGYLEMIQGRSLKDSKMKYLSIKANNDIDKIFGKYEIDETETVYCVEGPFDSLFVKNCIATCDANLTKAKADVYIWDNQPRNKDVIRYMEKAIDENKNIVIWPNTPATKLDINDLMKLGLSKDNLMMVIKKCTFSGLSAKVKFMQWKKVA